MTARKPNKPASDREEVILEAIKLTCGDRDVQYGPPVQNMTEIAELWSVFLQRQLTQPITAAQVANMMTLMKIARGMENHKRDNYADGIAYLGIAYECAESEYPTIVEFEGEY